MDKSHQDLTQAAIQLASKLAPAVLISFADQIEGQAERSLRQLSEAYLPQAYQRSAFQGLIASYEAQSNPPSRAVLASILRTAALSAKAFAERQQIELVTTGPAVQGIPTRRTDEALLDVIYAAQHSLIIVSFAVYNLSTIRDEVIKCAHRNVDIRICVEAPEPSGHVMANDTIKALGPIADHVRIYIWPNEKRQTGPKGNKGVLHTKCAIADEQLLFVSSANLTQSAMQLNMEMGVLIKGGEQPRVAANYFLRLIANNTLQEVV